VETRIRYGLCLVRTFKKCFTNSPSRATSSSPAPFEKGRKEGREGKGREGKGREGKGREGKGMKGRKGKER
jgi:hypothetical protein